MLSAVIETLSNQAKANDYDIDTVIENYCEITDENILKAIIDEFDRDFIETECDKAGILPNEIENESEQWLASILLLEMVSRSCRDDIDSDADTDIDE